MDLKGLRHQFLNRERKEGYENELLQLFGIKFGFEINNIALENRLQFFDIALLVSQDKTEAKLIESGYRLYEYVQPR